MRTENLAKLAVALSGIAWGLFWIPLRGLNGAGIDAFWSFIIFNATPAIILLPLVLARWRQQRAGGPWLFAIGLSMALTQFFYSLSFLHTEIVRAMILFYFNPVWATIMARDTDAAAPFADGTVAGATTTKDRREVITYDGSATAKIVITQDGTTKTCSLPLPRGMPTCN